MSKNIVCLFTLHLNPTLWKGLFLYLIDTNIFQFELLEAAAENIFSASKRSNWKVIECHRRSRKVKEDHGRSFPWIEISGEKRYWWGGGGVCGL